MTNSRNNRLVPRRVLLLVAAATIAAAPLAAGSGLHAQAAPGPHVLVRTSLGDIVIELLPDRAPATVANFLRYVDAGHFDGGQFHRTVTPQNQPADSIRIEVVQASVNTDRQADGFGTIPLERTRVTGLRHLDGTVSMARAGPDTATSSFFICIGDQPSLDFGGGRNPDGQGFAAFGRVIRGMDVVRAIQRAPSDGQRLEPPVRINSVSRIQPAQRTGVR